MAGGRAANQLDLTVKKPILDSLGPHGARGAHWTHGAIGARGPIGPKQAAGHRQPPVAAARWMANQVDPQPMQLIGNSYIYRERAEICTD